MIATQPLSPPTRTTSARRTPGRVHEPTSGDLATAPEPSAPDHSKLAAPAGPDTILRFLLGERLLHWAIAIPFLCCFLSALVLLLVFNHNPTGVYRPVFAWMHRGAGAGLIVCPALVVLASGRHLRIHFYNVRQAWVWRLDDIKWLALMGPAALFQRIVLPDQGKFNAAEKLNFMMVMVFPPLFIATGLLIWFPDHTPLGSFGAWLIHCALAAAAAPLVLGHIIMATMNPSTRVGLTGMISGFVSREWAAHHYARWFREQFPDLAGEPMGAPIVDPHGATADAASELPAAAVGAEEAAAAPAVSLPGFDEQAVADVLSVGDPSSRAAPTPSVPALGAHCVTASAARSNT